MACATFKYHNAFSFKNFLFNISQFLELGAFDETRGASMTGQETMQFGAAKVSIYGHIYDVETPYASIVRRIIPVPRRVKLKRQTKRLWRLRGPTRRKQASLCT